ncbi:MAG TPA: methyltransferase domain-containing protein [Candidatus Acidoferrum sp.]
MHDTLATTKMLNELRSLAERLWPERIIPAATPFQAFSEAGMRYAFAAEYAKGADVLDVACGTGIGTNLLRLAGAKTATGIDLSEECISVARKLYEGCNFLAADGCAYSFPEGSFDVIVSFETIEHVSHPQRFLDNCQRMLRASGVLVLSTPNFSVSRFAPNPYHVREFEPEELWGLVRERFKDVAVFGQNYVNLLMFVPVKGVTRLLDAIHLKDFVKALTRPRSSELVEDWNFELSRLDGRCAVLPYEAGTLHQPTYLIVVARKLDSAG